MSITRTDLTQAVAAIEPAAHSGTTSQDGLGSHPVRSVDRSGEGVGSRAGQDNEGTATGDVKTVRLPDFPNYELSIRLDPEIHRVVVHVIDSQSRAVIRSIPPDDVVKMLKQLGGQRGVLLDQEG
jgi:uncharacterized FlaG/YvyC family protein